MQLLQRPQGQIVDGQIRLNLGDKAYDIAKTPMEKMQKLRGNYMSMIFQEPMTSLNPVFRIGEQVEEVIELHDGEGKSKEEIKARTIELLEMVGIANSEGVYKMFPHELSGGMRQRVGIAMAISFKPSLLLADEPTSALDVTTQAQIVKELIEIPRSCGTAMIVVTHNIGVAAYMSDKIMVMKQGKIIEYGKAKDIINSPQEEYTKSLLIAVPQIGGKRYV